MTDYSELLGQLRGLALQIDPFLFGGPDARMLKEAAAAIETLTRELGEATEMQRLAKEEGVSETLAQIDRLTGGDGEYRFCLGHASDRHCPDEAAMQAKIVARFESTRADLTATKARMAEAVGIIRGIEAAQLTPEAGWNITVLNRGRPFIRAFLAKQEPKP